MSMLDEWGLKLDLFFELRCLEMGPKALYITGSLVACTFIADLCGKQEV